jgi:hypothetical protein
VQGNKQPSLASDGVSQERRDENAHSMDTITNAIANHIAPAGADFSFAEIAVIASDRTTMESDSVLAVQISGGCGLWRVQAPAFGTLNLAPRSLRNMHDLTGASGSQLSLRSQGPHPHPSPVHQIDMYSKGMIWALCRPQGCFMSANILPDALDFSCA